MAKLLVHDEQRGAKIPFLRGVLTRSLQNAGLEFADAYRVATEIRDHFAAEESVSNVELRRRIIEKLGEEFPNAVLSRYQDEDAYKENLQVVHTNGNVEPFSRGVHAQRLESCSLPKNHSNAVTRRIHSKLVRDKQRKISTDELISMTYAEVLRQLGSQPADCYLVWNDFLRGTTPLIVLIGGVPGSGKSTIAAELSNRLSIVRTQSTDMLREVMRVLIPQTVSPHLHASSFEAGRLLEEQENALEHGYTRQKEMVEVACNAVIRRAINERVSLILEGVHITPTLLSHLDAIEDADVIIVPIMLGVLDKEHLIHHIRGRSGSVQHRRAERYLQNIDKIWQLQTGMLSDADTADFTIINNINRDQSISEAIRAITQAIVARAADKLDALRAEQAGA